jgi:hypothetical protein|tara:strand:+ start:87333 stop:87866 length:534 start_codon:yes stop_codon:yes gene_type:complete
VKVILYIISLFVATTAFCQNKNYSTQFNVTLGAGLPETLHGGIRINRKQWHFDASGGTTLGGLFTVNGNAAYHFGSKNNVETNELKPWYTSLGVSYMQRESSTIYSQDTYLNGRIGRDFRMNDWFKLSFSVGLGVIVYHYKYDKDPGGWDFDIWVPVIPSGQFSLQFMIFDLDNSND